MIYLLPHLLAESAERFPDRTAVVCGDERLSYQELAHVSGKLARALVERGVRRGDRVGIDLPKSVRAVASVFGILKAGGVYVPIDPGAPALRAAHIVRDCGIRCLITTGRRSSRLSEEFEGGLQGQLDTLILVDTEWEVTDVPGAPQEVLFWDEVERESQAQPAVTGVDVDLAYILYTSGSTGVPKGVMISHRAALTFIDWTFKEFGIGHTDVVSNHAPLHFDLSIFDIFTTIKAGGTIAVVPPHTSTFPIVLARFIRDQGISVWYSVPSALIQMLVRGNFAEHDYPRLRLILFAGEVFPIKFLRPLRECTSARLYNLYGPTETNVCTYYEVGEIPSDREEPVPIGKAICNYEVFALNEAGRSIRPGDVGELYARGPGLMSGYWGDPEKTDSVLVSHPLQGTYRERVCRTGDLVTLGQDGDYLFLGRRDQMVKSRGYRIELGEIEATLYSHPDVREAAVVAVPDEEITNRLLAFVVPGEADGLTAEDVLRHCTDRLPRYMVPESVEFRKTLPKTSTGKIDRRALASG